MYYVGDVVQLACIPERNADRHPGLSVGMTGVIVGVNGARVGVCFDEYFGGHSCYGACDDGRGWYLFTDCLVKSVEEDTDTEEYFFSEQDIKSLLQ